MNYKIRAYRKYGDPFLDILQEEALKFPDCLTLSKKGVLRGLHFQTKHTQGKLVRATAGAILDVAVDLRKDSPTFGKHFLVELTADNKKMVYIPQGFAHGFLTLEDNTEFQYKCTDYYAPEFDSGVLWNDSDIGINWNFEKYGLSQDEIILSDKDKNNKR